MLNKIDKEILAQVSDLHDIPQGAFNIRKNGKGIMRNTTSNIDIKTKEDKPGIDIIVKPFTKGESVHIPVLLTHQGMEDLVYNNFDIGEGSDVIVIAGCGIHNVGDNSSRHDGIHKFIVRKNARMKYVEKHFALGEGSGKKILNPKTIIEIEEGGYAEIETVQIKGVDYSKRETEVQIHGNGHLLMTERLLTEEKQFAESDVIVDLVGTNSSVQIISRSVAKGESEQIFYPRVNGHKKCKGHVQCDAIIMHKAKVRAIPEIAAYHSEAELVHEAAIGQIAGEALIKLMTLGLSREESEEAILKGFLR